MADTPKAVFLVDVTADPVVIRIDGRASYLNCGPVSKLFKTLAEKKRTDVVIDFSGCTGMDSTFLGIMAAAALGMRRQNPPGTLTLARLGARNLELVRNLGLHRLLTIAADERDLRFPSGNEGNFSQPAAAAADPGTILRAHQALVDADESNRNRFQDVLAFLKNQIDQEPREP